MSAAPRLKDVAQHAGVAVSTASMALSNHPDISRETRERVLASGRKLGYPRSRRASSATAGDGAQVRLTLALFGAQIDDTGYANLTVGLATAAARADARLEMASLLDLDDEAGMLKRLERATTATDVILACGLVGRQFLSRLAERRPRILAVGPVQDEPGISEAIEVPQIVFDDVTIGSYATEYLLGNGHRRIAYVSSSLDPGMTHDRQYRGYQLALLRAGVTPAAEWLATTPSRDAQLADEVARLQALPSSPTAYVVANAVDAASVRMAFVGQGRELAPADMVIIDMAVLSERFGLQAYPAIRGRTDSFIQQTISMARRLAAGDDFHSVTTTVGFEFTEPDGCTKLLGGRP